MVPTQLFLDMGQWHLQTTTATAATLTLQSTDDTPTVLTRLELSTAIEVVGVSQALDGSMAGQLQATLEKAGKWNRAIQTSTLPRQLIWQAL